MTSQYLRSASRAMCLGTILALCFATGCNPGTPDPVTPDQARSTEQRITDPAPVPADLAELVAGNTAFALDLHGELALDPGNLFHSPFSVSLALAMTWAGAQGETALQMADTLHFTLPPERLHPAFNALDLALASRGENALAADGQGFRLNVVNATWGQTGYPWQTPFLDVLAQNYGAGMFLLDYTADPELCRETINTWVEDQTEGRIEDLIPPGVISQATRLVLANAIYFNAAWLNPFDEDATVDGPFRLLDGSSVTVPLMHQSELLAHAAGDGWQAVELPYDGEELSMVVVLPDGGRFDEVEGALDDTQLGAILGALAPTNVALTLPRFQYTSSFFLNEPLVDLGMTNAFNFGDADFSGMDGSRSLYIGAVIHKAFVSVNEAGTEAAAATAVIVDFGSAPEYTEVTVDRPFLFLIRDLATGSVLFFGRVVDPS